MSHDEQVEGRVEEGLAAQIGHLILEADEHGTDADERAQTFAEADHLRLVRRSAVAHEVSGQLLQQAVSAARSGGLSWAVLGQELGLSRQGAQQRFGGTRADPDEGADGADERWLGPVTAFDELGELELAGRLGWHTVEVGMFRHRMVRTQTQWEHRRVVWAKATSAYLKDGWQIGAKAFPWLYLVRDTGRPVEEAAAG